MAAPLAGAPPARVAPPADSRPERSPLREEGLDLARALDLALRDRPELAEARARTDAAEARARAAGRWPNPELIGGFEAASFDGGTFDRAELLLGVSQEIPLTGRAGEARAAGLLARDTLDHAAGARLLELRREVHGAFATALHAQDVVALYDGLTAVSGELLELVRSRRAAGDALRTDVLRAEVAHARTEREGRRAQTLRAAAFLDLAAATGDPARGIDSVAGDLGATLELPALEAMVRRLDAHPSLLAARAEVEAVSALVEVAELQRIPDLRVSLLYRRDEELGDDGFDVMLGIPIPLFDTGRDRVTELRHDALAARAAERSARVKAESELRRAHQGVARALDELAFQEREVIPLAGELATEMRARYELGDVSLAEVFVVEEARARTRLVAAELRGDVHRAWAVLASYLAQAEHGVGDGGG